MNAVPTTTIAILRGTSTDGYGDEVDTDTPVATGVPASIIEQRKTVTTKADPQPRVVRTYTGRVGGNTDIRDGDRVRDERTARVYLVDSSSQLVNPVLTNDINLDLRRVT